MKEGFFLGLSPKGPVEKDADVERLARVAPVVDAEELQRTYEGTGVQTWVPCTWTAG